LAESAACVIAVYRETGGRYRSEFWQAGFAQSVHSDYTTPVNQSIVKSGRNAAIRIMQEESRQRSLRDALCEAIPAQDDEIASQRALANTAIAAIFGIAGP
jgi:hypothetical protein